MGTGTNFREEFADTPLLKRDVSKFNIAAMVGIPLAAILFQVYVPRFFERLSYLELPLLVTVYFSLMRRSPGRGSPIRGRHRPGAGLLCRIILWGCLESSKHWWAISPRP